nr:RNA-dependent RNA polymerase [Durnavirales sp.]
MNSRLSVRNVTKPEGGLMHVENFVNRGPFRRAGISEYVKRMRASDRVLHDDFVAQILDHQDISYEASPRSIFDPDQMFETLRLFGKTKNIKVDTHLQKGFDFAKKIFAFRLGRQKLKALSDQEIIKAIKLEKSSGLPLLTTKKNALPYAIDRLRQIRLGIKTPNPCIAFARTQQNNKTRLVWGFPLEMTMLESKYARPLIDNFMLIPTPMSIGLMKPELGGRLLGICNKKKNIYGLDYSKFDSSISSTLIRYSFDILKTWFEYIDENEWSIIVNYFCSTPIVMPNGNLYTGKRHGVPSGSYFTQLIDSVVNVILIGALSSKFQLDIYHRELFVLGDDSIFATRQKLDLQKVAEFLMTYGIKLNIEKSTKNQVHYLGATWKLGLPDLDVKQLAAKAVYPETFRKYSDHRRDPRGVLLSYASQYLSGIKFIKTNDMSCQFTISIPKAKYLSGNDKFQLEYFGTNYNSRLPSVLGRMLT